MPKMLLKHVAYCYFCDRSCIESNFTEGNTKVLPLRLDCLVFLNDKCIFYSSKYVSPTC